MRTTMRSSMLWMVLLGGCWVSPEQVFEAQDRDGDGFTHLTDCDNQDPTVNPDAEEVCGDGVDNNCDGRTDDIGIGAVTFYLDEDGDGWGVDTATTVACVEPPGYATQVGDCDDSLADVNPGLLDNSCDGFDNNCNSQIDEDAEVFQSYPDSDGDGFGDGNQAPVSGCSVPANYAANGNDCDDTDTQVNPLADEVDCDGIDNDCNPQTGDVPTRYFDDDEDGYGDPATAQDTCASDQWVDVAEDCDDADPLRNPGVAEVACDGFDNDCDDTTADGPLQYEDLDGDGYGNASVSRETCDAGWVQNSDDCDDTDATKNPDTLWYPDGDADGYGTGTPLQQCEDPGGHALADGDCDDANPRRSPGLPELCDFDVDNDCDAQTLDEQVISIAGELEAYDTLQAAFDAMDPLAPAVEVDVCPGTYLGGAQTSYGGVLSLAGTDPNVATTLDAEGDLQVLVFEGAGDLIVRDLILTGGNGIATATCDGNGGGICAPNADTVTLTDTILRANSANQGGGIATGAATTLLRVTLDANSAAAGGGAYLSGPSNVITDSSVTGNEADDYGGGFCIAAGTSTLTGTEISSNQASEGGGVAIVGEATLSDMSVMRNSASQGAGVWVSSSMAPVVLRNTTIRTDARANRGGGLFVESSDLQFIDSSAYANAPTGGAASFLNSSVSLTRSTFTGVSASGRGGGIHVEGSTLWMDGGSITFSSSPSGFGGSLYALNSDVNLENTVINESTASFGGAISLVSSTMTCDLCTIKNSAADYGGAAFVGEGSTLLLRDSTLTNNESPIAVSGVFLEGDPVAPSDAGRLELERSQFTITLSGSDQTEVGHWTDDGSPGTELSLGVPHSTICTGDAGCSP